MNFKSFRVFVFFGVFIFLTMPLLADQPRTSPWTKEQANQWYQQKGWLRGCNFTPSNAINQLEMWQAETFDPAAIDRELGWAAAIGMNCMRVYLHHAAWNAGKDGFKKRMGKYLEIADKHGIVTMFVFFDDCWNATYFVGKQPEPQPGIHNSGWVRDPGDLLFEKPELINLLEIYVKDVLTAFKDDKRILLWDLYNEPGNSKYGNKSLDLVKKSFDWAWTVNPSQPLSIGYWTGALTTELNKFQLENSDIITYHTYQDLAKHKGLVESLKSYGRPMICTEYMARHFNSTFQEIMPMLKAENIGAINWGLVAGKTNTIFKWSEPLPETPEPPLWFHDIFRKDGTPYSQKEVEVIKSLCEK
ncbi:MAG: cellulase family glycosylhydrolase [Planctomycetaceae bacterium]|nr:cellulase family glycosylhydrolase [Planctomycetaceae bacterium]